MSPASFIDRLAAGQPDAVKAVLDVAYARPAVTPEAFDRIIDHLFPDHADTFRQIADELEWAEQFRADPPSEVLRRFYGHEVGFLGERTRACDEIADVKEAHALFLAQAVATLVTQHRAVA